MEHTDGLQRVLDVILEINTGTCSVTEQDIIEAKPEELREALAGLLYLHEDLDLRRQQAAQREEHLRLRQSRLQALNSLTKEIVGNVELGALLQRAIDRAVELSDAHIGALIEIDRQTGELGRAYQHGFHPGDIPPRTSLEGRGILGAVAGGMILWSADMTREPEFGGFPSWHPQLGPGIGIPLVHEGDTLAILCLGRLTGAPAFDEEEFQVVQSLAGLVSVALHMRHQRADLERLNDALTRQATTDPLMGIGNRRAFDEAIVWAHAAATRYRTPYSVLMIDVDEFKTYNDGYGHQAGDLVLLQVATAIASAVRSGDRVFRYGGEELVVICRVDLRAGVATLGERLRGQVEALQIEHQGSKSGVITCSFGGARWGDVTEKEPNASWQQVVQQADAALYRAKEQGRNCVVVVD